ncbi:MAG: 3-deoxy-manno-octulosonate cytidylyltransferase, partial [Pseudomonadota bacterium]
SPKCRNGTERCAEVLERLSPKPDLLVNVQGDAPLTPPDFVEALVDGIGDGDVATPVLRCDASILSRFRADRRQGRVGGTLAVMDRAMNALYFSKELIPFADHMESDVDARDVFHHVGLYAFTPRALQHYLVWPPGLLELREGLEQLRFLEHGATIKCVEVEGRGRPFWELNNPVDVERIERALMEFDIA